MRTRIIVAVLGALAIFGSLSTAEGQTDPNTFTVEKVVEGPVPAGTIFEVEVVCTGRAAAPTEGIPPTVLQFDEEGNPIGDNSVPAGFFTDCTATETDDGGAASVSYACEATAPTPTVEGAGSPQVQCLDDQTVRFDDVAGAQGTITVTNTFEDVPPPPPPPDVDPDDVVDDGVVTATPAFTG